MSRYTPGIDYVEEECIDCTNGICGEHITLDGAE